MEELKFAKYFDYSLHLSHELVKEKIDNPKEYQVVWKINNNFVTASAFRYRKDMPFETVIDKEWQVDEQPIYSDKNSFPLNVREKFFKYFGIGKTFNSFGSLYSNDAELFNQLLKFVKSSRLIGAINDDQLLYNVKIMNSNIELPFIEISDKDKIRPVSLIEVSEN
ncbi:hypothetical protein [Limosilactobacillus agrestimuris]|uniref:hypothetical protein n=1 Tax=Limosilactobacillus agrestimuris TaxID=2941331 RepID=UPI0020417A01|nr:hypothetical protein [Limosilactobacillus agrestimuris]